MAVYIYPMLKKTRALLSDTLIRSSGLMFTAFMISSVFNYLFQVIMGRLLGPGQYGFLNALLALMAVLGIPIATLLMVVSRKTAEYKARSDYNGIHGLFSQVNRTVLSAGGLGLVLFMLCSAYISAYLHAPSALPVIFIGLAAFASLAGPINTALLQGLQDYKWLGISMGFGGPVRLFFCAALVLAGFGVNGAAGGLVVTAVFMWALTYFPLKKYLLMGGAPHRAGHLPFGQIMPVFLANLAFTVMTQADMVLVNRYFPAHQAGVYASAAILGRAVMYIPGSIVLAMFPMVSENNALNKSSGHLLLRAMLATLGCSGTGALLFYFLPEWIIHSFFGARYIEAAPLLKYFGLAMLPMAFLMVLMNYLVAKEKTLFAYIMAAGAALEIAAMYLYHGVPLDIVKAMSAGGTLALLAGIAAQWALPARAVRARAGA